MRRTKSWIAFGLLATLLVPAAACSKADEAAVEESAKPVEPRRYAGVEPEKFDCNSIAAVEALATVLGGETRQTDAMMSPAPGTPKRCEYDVTRKEEPKEPPKTPGKTNGKGSGSAKPAEPVTIVEHWSYDFDCRPTYKRDADTQMAQFAQQSADAVKHYQDVLDAGVAKSFNATDAGVETHTAPTGAFDVQVGQKGIDVLGQGLLFVDDDAPCLVRVLGPDAARRLELAKLVAKNLTFANAPMKPRPL
ncbi:MAG: hypothetical protein KF773_32565 [Deltaproteobacteria bacterium]|nr:hypothetical protein [Deltaproteobacteria bacterium]